MCAGNAVRPGPRAIEHIPPGLIFPPADPIFPSLSNSKPFTGKVPS